VSKALKNQVASQPSAHLALFDGTNALQSAPLGPSFEPIPPESGDPDAPLDRIATFDFSSAILPDDRRVTVYLPPQYQPETTRRFPVFYLHDGQNLFDPRTSYIPGRTWRAGSTADFLAESGLAQPVILVGVANTGLRRMAEYTPTRDSRMGGGEGDRYGRLLIEEIKPFIDNNFRTLPDAAHTGIGGSSLGGLISLYLGLRHPNVFTRLAILSPSLWWDHRSILATVRQFHPSARPLPRIWLDIGTAEGARHVRDTQLLNRILEQRGWQPGIDLHFATIHDAVHDEDAWAARFGQVLAFLFPVSEHGPTQN
jgi:predicted alpha/beta superfamily hydrolase